MTTQRDVFEYIAEKGEIITGRMENAGYRHFLLFAKTT